MAGMNQTPPKSIVVPPPVFVLLSVIAGYVDSCTYLGLFGVFVAPLTGSLVLAGTGFVRSEPGVLAKLLAIPFFFLAGMAVAVLAHAMKERPRAALVWSLVGECVLLMGLSVSCLVGMPFHNLDAPGAVVAVLFGIAAMGVQSALVRLLLRSANSTNVMTTNTTMLAIGAAELLVGWIDRRRTDRAGTSKEDDAQDGRQTTALLQIWLGFFAGTALGAVAYITMGLPCVLLAILPVGSLALWYTRPAS
jgi:uncharacterized membrane protein YoaK (UPF0700 family)